MSCRLGRASILQQTSLALPNASLVVGKSEVLLRFPRVGGSQSPAVGIQRERNRTDSSGQTKSQIPTESPASPEPFLTPAHSWTRHSARSEVQDGTRFAVLVSRSGIFRSSKISI